MIFAYGQKHFRRQVGARCLHVTTTCEKPFSQTDVQGDQLQRLDFLCARTDPLFLSLPAADLLFLRLSAVDAPLPSPPATYPLFLSHAVLDPPLQACTPPALVVVFAPSAMVTMRPSRHLRLHEGASTAPKPTGCKSGAPEASHATVAFATRGCHRHHTTA